jgi:hypothetical protein
MWPTFLNQVVHRHGQLSHLLSCGTSLLSTPSKAQLFRIQAKTITPKSLTSPIGWY